ncbi:MAG: IS1595 family transposase [Flavobacteriaceae bacterium]|nr:IS1595 family transposase [Flavobacteriaceae bacterium]
MDIFKGKNLIEFSERFKTDADCKKYLAEVKWEKGFKCRKCGHTKAQIRKDFSRTCNICSDTESASAGGLFHRVKFGLKKAFFICFEMGTTSKGMSALQVSERYGISEKTARLFMHKVREAMKSSENYPMKGQVHTDEFVVGGKEKGKQGRSYDTKKKKVNCAIELSDKGGVKRFYALKIKDFSSKSLRNLFNKHIDKTAKVTADKWKGYNPLEKEYDITQIKSEGGKNFILLHTMIHQVKSWLRTIFSWVSDKNIQRYLNEFSYRINRSNSKETIFHNLIKRMSSADKITQRELVCG